MMLNITATASLALPSAVSVAPRFQSHRSQLCASFARRCPQYGHGIVSPVLCSGRVAGASVYSTLISIVENHKSRRIRQENLTTNEHPPRKILTARSPAAAGSPEITEAAEFNSKIFLCELGFSRRWERRAVN